MRKFDSSEIILIVTNCVPILGVLFFDWTLFSLLMSYWLETGVIGIFIFLKSQYLYRKSRFTPFIVSAFAILNMCSAFMFAHFIGIMSLYSVLPGGDGWTGINLLKQSYDILAISLVSLLINYTYSFYYNFIGRNEYEIILKTALEEKDKRKGTKTGKLIVGGLMTRIVLIQLVVIIGGVILAATKTTIYLSIIFILVKIIIDLILHRKRHSLLKSQLDKFLPADFPNP